MALFEEAFADPAKLSHDWIVAPGCAITADIRIVCAALGFVLRAVGPGQYYMVQFDLANNPSVVWFHTLTPSADGGYRVELVPSSLAPQAGVWHRMSVVARGDAFEVLLGEPGGPLRHCASWEDSWHTYRQGAVGVWEHGGEAGEYRAFRVEALASDAA